jgi:hypothetical protein
MSDADDKAWAEHVAQLRACEVAERLGITVEEVRARWAAEDDLGRTSPKPDGASLLASEFTIESEMRGETIHYIEPARRTSMHFFWTSGYEVHADTIETWSHPADRQRTPVTPAEREQIVGRVVEWAKRVQGVTLTVIG